MPVRLKKLATSGVYGLLDLGTEELDRNLATKDAKFTESFKNVTDWQRTAAFLGGVATTYLSRDARLNELGEDLYTASLPLFEKSLWRLVRKSVMGMSSPTERRVILRNRGSVSTESIVPVSGILEEQPSIF